MATLTLTELQDLVLDRLQANVTVDPAFESDELLRHINDAYADVWEISGGALKRVPGPTMWEAQNASHLIPYGTFQSLLTDIGEIRELFASASSGSNGRADNGDTLLAPADIEEIHWHRANQTLFGKYARPKLYAAARNFTQTAADVNVITLEVWPGTLDVSVGVPDLYFPVHYIPQFTPLDAISVTVPAVNDLESRDIGLLAAARMAPLTGRAEFVPGIMADISQRTALGLERKFGALLDARADQ